MTSHVHLIAFGIFESIRKTMVTMSKKSSKWCLFCGGISWAVGGLIGQDEMGFRVGWCYAAQQQLGQSCGRPVWAEEEILGATFQFQAWVIGLMPPFLGASTWRVMARTTEKKRGPTCFHLICLLLLFEFPFKISLGLPSILGGLYIPCSCLHARLHGVSWALWYWHLSNDFFCFQDRVFSNACVAICAVFPICFFFAAMKTRLRF